jgi:hypothetical protein
MTEPIQSSPESGYIARFRFLGELSRAGKIAQARFVARRK